MPPLFFCCACPASRSGAGGRDNVPSAGSNTHRNGDRCAPTVEYGKGWQPRFDPEFLCSGTRLTVSPKRKTPDQ